MTANQIVAQNLRRARLEKGWTQEEAAVALEPHIGVLWSKASYSAAERSATSDRIRQFDADIITAFATTFDKPFCWWLTEGPPVCPCCGQALGER